MVTLELVFRLRLASLHFEVHACLTSLHPRSNYHRMSCGDQHIIHGVA